MVKGKKVNGKRKGNSFELQIAKEIAETIGVEYGKMVRRTPGSGSLLCRADLWVHSSVRHNFPWYLELKKRQTIRLEHLLKPNNDLVKWYRESKEKLKIDPEYEQMTTPTALLFAKNNMTPFIMLSLDDFKEMELRLSSFDFKLTFLNDGDEFIVLEWKKFLDCYRISA
jgi:hypothetical protein